MSDDRMTRWRLVLGGGEADGTGAALDGDAREIDRVLEALYDAEPGRRGGLGASSPYVARWLGDIRRWFDTPTVRVMQRDAIERLDLTQLLLEPELLEAVEPDVHLVATLLTLASAIPEETRATARRVVARLVDRLMDRLRPPMIEAVRGGVHRASHARRPRPGEIDWDRTIRRNLRHYLPEQRTIVPAEFHGHSHRRAALRDVFLCVDQSGSMAPSVVYAGIFASVLASLRSLTTRLAVFDTELVDLTEVLADPVDVLFGAQLGGGTDIDRALAWCQQEITRPGQTILVLITDLFEGGDRDSMLRRAARLLRRGVQLICLLALSDSGAPAWDVDNASELAALGVPTFACTPDLFPDLMAAAVRRQDLTMWAARHDVTVVR